MSVGGLIMIFLYTKLVETRDDNDRITYQEATVVEEDIAVADVDDARTVLEGRGLTVVSLMEKP